MHNATCRYSYGGGIGSIVTWTVATNQKSEIVSYLLDHIPIKVAQCLNAPLGF
jgi:hypothetical protein